VKLLGGLWGGVRLIGVFLDDIDDGFVKQCWIVVCLLLDKLLRSFVAFV
jgi:hypothetical protein